ncbi:hypothetical protein ACQP0C_20685 [Nocardia sp. CA-129566]|uniref:hypothetical protein n=1 Tax=Nocardia sp. CA-129566 TaxID=3239976 RepID=UPI003D99C0B8
MNLIGRLRHGGSVVAVLIAMLLVAPMVHCAHTDDHEHSDVHGQMVPGDILTVALGDSPHVVIDASHESCGVHLAHCIVKSVRAGEAENFAALRLLALIAVVAIVAAAIHSTLAGGVRGPPVCPPVAAGRDILERFCIARR